jgi:hypothetical protein
VKKTSGTDAARRAALKALVPAAHQVARTYATRQGLDFTPIEHAAVSVELRKLADRMDDLAERGSAAVVASFFGAEAG